MRDGGSVSGGTCPEGHGHAPGDVCLECLRAAPVVVCADEGGGIISRGLADGSIELLDDEDSDVFAIPSDAEADLNALADYGRAGSVEL